MIEVVAVGAATTVQDVGRPASAHLGVPRSGASDLLAMLAANRAVGNRSDAAILEATLTGPTLRAHTEVTVAIVGGGFGARIGPTVLEHGRPYELRAGEELDVGRRGDGLRCAIAVRGGWASPLWLGSRSQLVDPGLATPALATGDRLQVGAEIGGEPAAVSIPATKRRLRVIPVEGAVLGTDWTVTPDADRRGVRMAIESPLEGGAEIDPEPMPFGAIQLPPDGQPIVLGPDGPVTGGYRIVGTVIAADMSVLAQTPPGGVLRIESRTIEQARQAWQDACHSWTRPST